MGPSVGASLNAACHRLLALWTLLLLVWVQPALAAPWGDLPTDPAAASATVRQRVVPELDARARAAVARREAREAFFTGEGTLVEAFPDLTGVALDTPLVLSGRLLALDDVAVERAGERMTPLPAGLDTRARTALSRSLAAALDAEDAADALERRLLLELRAWLAANPDWTAAGLAPLRDEARSWIDASVPEDDAGRAEAARRALDADEALRRLDTLTAEARRMAVVAGAPLPDTAPEQDRLKQGRTDAATRHALERLRRVEVLASGDARAALEAVEASWLRGSLTPRLSSELAMLTEAQAQPLVLEGTEEATLEASLAEARDALAAAKAVPGATEEEGEGPLSPLEDLRGQAARQGVAVAEARFGLAEARLEILRGRRAPVDADKAREEADAAQAEAEAARLAALDARDRLVAEVRAGKAAAKQRVAEAAEARDAVAVDLGAPTTAVEERMSELEARVDDILGRSRLDPERPDPDAAYRALRLAIRDARHLVDDTLAELDAAGTALDDTQGQVIAESQAIDAVGERVDAIVEDDLRAEGQSLITTWREALEDELRARVERRRDAEAILDRQLSALRDIKRSRRVLQDEVSSQTRWEDRSELIVDLRYELRLLRPQAASLLHDRYVQARELPATLTDFNRLSGVISGSLGAMTLALIWLILRMRVDDLSRPLAGLTDPDPDRRARLAVPLAAVLRAVVDLVFASQLGGLVAEASPELGLLLDLLATLARYQLVLRVVNLAVVPYPDDRPHWIELERSTWTLVRRTARLLVAWGFVRSMLVQALLGTLGADALAWGVERVSELLLVALVLWLLMAWVPELHRRIGRLDQDNRWVRLLSHKPGVLTRPFYAVAAGTFLLLAGSRELLQRRIAEQESLGRIFSVLDRLRLVSDERPEAAVDALSPELLAAVTADLAPDEAPIARREAEAALRGAVTGWREERRRGLVVLTGDRGGGRGVLVDQFIGDWGIDGVPATRVRLDRRLATERDALEWLVRSLGLEVEGRVEAIAAALRGSPRVIVLEELHFAFLRRVFGFEGLSALARVWNATGEDVLWIVTVHRPAWQLFTRLGAMLPLGGLRAEINLPGLGPKVLQTMIEARMGRLGLIIDPSRLVVPSVFGADPLIEEERAVSTFYRLLAEASAGQPGVALRLWGRCLLPTPDANRVQVTMHPCLAAGIVSDLSDDQLFVLTALRVHERLEVTALADVTNLPEGRVQAAVQHLHQRRLVIDGAKGVTIELTQLPDVTRTLRRRHFLQWV